ELVKTPQARRQENKRRRGSGGEIRNPPAVVGNEMSRDRLDREAEQSRAEQRQSQREPLAALKTGIDGACPGNREAAGAEQGHANPGRVEERQAAIGECQTHEGEGE